MPSCVVIVVVVVVVVGSIHGDERAGGRVVRRLRAAPLPDGVDLWLVRTVNPGGVAVDRRTNASGVDLDRSFLRHRLRAGAGHDAVVGAVRRERAGDPRRDVPAARGATPHAAGAAAQPGDRPASAALRPWRCLQRHPDGLAQRAPPGPRRTVGLGRSASDDEVASVASGPLPRRHPLTPTCQTLDG